MRFAVWSAAAVVAAVGLLAWTAGSPGDRVLAAVQPLFVDPATAQQTARVDSCDQIGSSTAARIYLCNVTARTCSRYFQFAVFKDPAYAAMPVWAPAVALRHPCTPIHS
jgi:hypothetical protein